MIYRIVFLFFFLQTLNAWAIPTGEFLVGESKGGQFHHALRFEANQAIIQDFTQDGKTSRTLVLDVTSTGQNQYQLAGSERGQPVRGYLHFTSENEALMWISGQERLYWALRAVPADLSALQGHWSVLAKQDVWGLDIKDQNFELLRQGEKSAWSLHPVANPTEGVRAVAKPDRSTDLTVEDSYLLYFIQLGPDLWLVRNHEEDHFLMLFRENSRAMMEAEIRKRRDDATDERSTKKR